MAPLKLYHYPMSPPSRCALLTVRNVKVDAEVITVDLFKKDQLAPEFVKINPQHTVPTIDDNGFVLWESRAIATYLASTKAAGSSLYPNDPKKRAIVDARLYLDQALQIATGAIMYPIHAEGATSIPQDKKDKVYKMLGDLNTFMEGNSYAAGNELTVADLALLATISTAHYPIHSLGETKIPDPPKQRLYKLLGHLNDMMEGQKFVAGDEPTIADFSLLASFSTYYHAGANVRDLRNLMAWYRRCEALPGFQENEKEARAFGQMFKSKISVKDHWDE
uniref:glutathione transferase n=1 Tax=Lutzomyia longipalpis TaxID=7200 RepID=A0A1B0CWZ2_LUTLO